MHHLLVVHLTYKHVALEVLAGGDTIVLCQVLALLQRPVSTMVLSLEITFSSTRFLNSWLDG
jgi:hypothetical protein